MEQDLDRSKAHDSQRTEANIAGPQKQSAPYTVTWQTARTGLKIACLNDRPLASVYDPQKEAQRLLDGLLALARQHSDIRHIMIVGAGSPYLLEALEPAAASGPAGVEALQWEFSIVEPVADVYQWIRASGNWRTSIFKSAAEAQQYIQSRAVLVFPNRPLVSAFEVYRRTFDEVEQSANQRQINLNTLNKFGPLWVRNLYSNFTEFLNAGELVELQGAGKGKAAVLLGAGPSLTDHLPAIAASPRRDEFLIIAVDTALSVCRMHGLEPDFALTVDPQPINFYHMAGESFRRTILIADPACSPLALRRWKGPLLRLQNPFPLSRELARISNHLNEDSLGYGGSVSTNAYDLALYLECSEVLMVGQDLSFPASRVHASGAALEELWGFREKRLSSRETGNYRQRFSVPVVPLPSETDTVHSNDKLNVFYNWFNQRFARDAERIRISLLRSAGVRFSRGDIYDTFSQWEQGRSSPTSDHPLPRPDSNSSQALKSVSAKHPSSPFNLSRACGALSELRQEFQDLVSAARSEAALFENLQRLSRAIRLAGTGMQAEVERLQRSGRINDEFRKTLQTQAELHSQLLLRTIRRLEVWQDAY
ncbi:MAG: DUF115 domain-containing protein [Leptospiraceae bacterium]|nr:DUF115 domain-containing protein [Leptospiraceae bacterium]